MKRDHLQVQESQLSSINSTPQMTTGLIAEQAREECHKDHNAHVTTSNLKWKGRDHFTFYK